MRVEPQQLKAFIFDSELASKEKIEEAWQKAQKTSKNLEDVLINEGIITKEELQKLKAYILGIPYIDLSGEKINPEVLRIIPQPLAKKNNIVAFKKLEDRIEVAMLNPEDLQTIEFIKKRTGVKILPRLTSEESIRNVLRQYEESLEAEFGKIIREEVKGVKAVKEIEAAGGEELQKIAEELPIVRIVDTLIKHAILQRASDIHIEPMEKEVVVRYRIDGILHDAMILPKQVDTGIVARIKVLASLKLDEHRLPQDGRFKIESEEGRYSFRVSTLPVYNGEKIVMRILSETATAITLEELGFRGEALEQFHRALRRPIGIILICGPTGSGKTTTLYSAMDILNDPGVNISTIEDPIEYRMPRINQTQVKPEIGLTFANGLRSLVRQDPDILMVGEIRDNETASLAINAALTGHLVLSTLHTNSAAGALPRLIDMQVEPFLIASTVHCIVGQRLVRRLCEVKEKYFLKKEQIAGFSKEYGLERILRGLKEEKLAVPNADFSDIPFFKPKSSSDCPEGYKGRKGIYEVMEISSATREIIAKRGTMEEIEIQAKKEGMRTMLEDGFIKAAQGVTSIEEVLRVTRE